MTVYLLLRDKIKSGPYSLDDLKLAGIKPTDMLWIEGKSKFWQYPDEIEEIQAFVNFLSRSVKGNNFSDATFHIQIKENPDDKINTYDIINPEHTLPSGSASQKPTPNERDTGNSLEEKYIDQPTDAFANKIISVIIADDHTLFREGVKIALAHKKDIKIIGEADNGLRLLHLLKSNIPDVILLDIQMPLMDGITALTSIRKINKVLKVIILSMHNESSMVSMLMETGANGYLTKTADSEIIYEAIKTCYSKSYYFNDLTNMSMLEKIRSAKKARETYAIPKTENTISVVKLPESPKKTVRQKSIRAAMFIMAAIGSLLLIIACIAGSSYFFHFPVIDFGLNQDKKITDTAFHKIEPVKAAAIITKKEDSVSKTTDSLTIKNADSSLIEKSSQVLNTSDSFSDKKKNQALYTDDSISLNKNEKAVKNKTAATNKNDQPKKQKINKPAAIPILSKPVSVKKTDSAANKKESAVEINNYKMKARENNLSLVRLTAFESKSGKANGELFTQLKINNRTTFKIDTVFVEVRYFSPDSTLYKKENLIFHSIEPFTSAVRQTHDYKKVETIKYRITSIKSKALDIY